MTIPRREALEGVLERLTERLRPHLYPDAEPPDYHHYGEWLLQLETLAEIMYELDVESDDAGRALVNRAVRLMGAPVEARKAAATLFASGPPGEDGRYAVRILTVRHCSTSARELHEALSVALGFPNFYGKNWNAFWEVVTGLVAMPRELHIWDWPYLRNRLPGDARHLLRCLQAARRECPGTSSIVELRDTNWGVLEVSAELTALKSSSSR